MKTLHLSIIFVILGSTSIIYTVIETQYRIHLMLYGVMCKIGSSCGGFPAVDPFWVGLGAVLIGIGISVLILLIIRTKFRKAPKS